MKQALSLIAGFAVLLLAACSSDDVHAAPSSTSGAPITRVIPPGLEPPVQHNDPGIPDVPFDPCLDIDDSHVRQLGVDPRSKNRDDMVAENTYLRCIYSGPTRYVTVMALNTTFETQLRLAANRERPIQVNGRESFIGVNGVNPDGCTLVMRTKFGVAIVDTNNVVPGRAELPSDPCEGVPELGAVVEPLLPRG